MNIRHIYWFAYYNISEPSVRYRGLYALRELEKKYGITYTIIYPGYSFENIAHFIRNYFSILFFRRSKSIIVFEKIRTGWIYGSALKILLWMRPERTAYDIDDADYLKFKPGNIYHFMKNCEKCFVGSKTLLEFTLQFNTNVYLAPSPVINHNCRKGIKNERLTIGWIGYYNAHRDSLLKLFFPALLNISFPVKLILLGVTN